MTSGPLLTRDGSSLDSYLTPQKTCESTTSTMDYLESIGNPSLSEIQLEVKYCFVKEIRELTLLMQLHIFSRIKICLN